ncbi:hypothetical protein DSAG12_03742 [Promethearchaeum syntrophicum]|uniref:Uncharacterized protein n=1 Tax=Promethearchaeum syntrophicum TaxID=2594042 RepID=A0A5B9DFK2_9ARCH|nr:hypothetical protein [Candidatus Prometheoarchaeum syntrophicum]QEE17904.1 hypothetical protein DSAG12_03742 [Candidatus Prometheoarchaeum syntrophicum]
MNQNENPPIDNFLRTLLEVVKEKSSNINAQIPRLHKLWRLFWGETQIELKTIRSVFVDDKRFITDLQYRFEVVRNLQHAMNDGFFVVKSIIEPIFSIYMDSDLISKDFSNENLVAAKLIISDVLVGSLLQFIVIDKNAIPIPYIIIAKNKALMKVKALSIDRITEDMKKNGFEVSTEYVTSVFNDMIQLGYILCENSKESDEIVYKFVKDFSLSELGQRKFDQKIKPLLEWTIALWRSLFNIRSLDTPIPEDYPHRSFLVETVKRAATQGYLSAQNVMENIANYYEILLGNVKENS